MITEELVPVASITASTSKSTGSPNNGVINKEEETSDTSPSSWQPEDSDEEPYIEIRFNEPVFVTSVITKGGENGEFTPQFKIKTSISDKIEPVFVTAIETDSEGNDVTTPKVYEANNDDSTEVTNRLTVPVIAYVVRIYPIRPETEAPISLQVDLKGCLVIGSTTPPVGETTPYYTTTPASVETTLPPIHETTQEASATTPGKFNIQELLCVTSGFKYHHVV